MKALNCDWAKALSQYDCTPVRAIDGTVALEIGTPFSLPDSSAINLLLVTHGEHLLITDNADTIHQLSALGLLPWRHLDAIRGACGALTLSDQGDFRMLTSEIKAPLSFALAITGLLKVAEWAREQLGARLDEVDIVAEAEPYIIARNPDAAIRRNVAVEGLSHTKYKFDFLHGKDLIDVLRPNATATAHTMRKVGDVQNGPFAPGLSPLIIVDDRQDAQTAERELQILGSSTRAMPFTRLIRSGLH
jgi:hypothetical protein